MFEGGDLHPHDPDTDGSHTTDSGRGPSEQGDGPLSRLDVSPVEPLPQPDLTLCGQSFLPGHSAAVGAIRDPARRVAGEPLRTFSQAPVNAQLSNLACGGRGDQNGRLEQTPPPQGALSSSGYDPGRTLNEPPNAYAIDPVRTRAYYKDCPISHQLQTSQTTDIDHCGNKLPQRTSTFV